MKKQNGFTLLELLITCYIITLLAAHAIVAYQDYIRETINATIVRDANQLSTLARNCVTSRILCPTLRKYTENFTRTSNLIDNREEVVDVFLYTNKERTKYVGYVIAITRGECSYIVHEYDVADVEKVQTKYGVRWYKDKRRTQQDVWFGAADIYKTRLVRLCQDSRVFKNSSSGRKLYTRTDGYNNQQDYGTNYNQNTAASILWMRPSSIYNKAKKKNVLSHMYGMNGTSLFAWYLEPIVNTYGKW